MVPTPGLQNQFDLNVELKGAGAAVSIDDSQDYNQKEELKDTRTARHDQPRNQSSLSPSVPRRHQFDRSVGRFTREESESREGGSHHVSKNWRNNLFSKLQHE